MVRDIVDILDGTALGGWDEVLVSIVTLGFHRVAGDLVIATSRSHDEKKDVWSCGKTKKIARLIRMREDR